MSIFTNLFKNDKKNDIFSENQQLKRKRKNIQEELDLIKLEKEEITNKYINLLEKKAEEFDKYFYYQDLYKEVEKENKKYKKDLKELELQLEKIKEKNDKIKEKEFKNETKI